MYPVRIWWPKCMGRTSNEFDELTRNEMSNRIVDWQLKELLQDWRSAWKMFVLLEHRGISFTMHVAFISKKLLKTNTCIIPQKRYFSSLSSRCAAFTLMQAFKSSLLFIWMTSFPKTQGFFDWFFKDTPENTPETLLRILFLTNVWWETHLFLLPVILNPSQLKVRVGFCFF